MRSAKKIKWLLEQNEVEQALTLIHKAIIMNEDETLEYLQYYIDNLDNYYEMDRSIWDRRFISKIIKTKATQDYRDNL